MPDSDYSPPSLVVWTLVTLWFVKRDERIAARKQDEELQRSDQGSNVEKEALEGKDSPKAEEFLA